MDEAASFKTFSSGVSDNDRWSRWKFPGSKYRVAVWRIIRPKMEKVAWHKLLWVSYTVPKHVFIARKTILNRLHTMD